MTEEWRPITGHGAGHYEVSDQGRVRRLTTRGGRLLALPTQVKVKPNRKGYMIAKLTVGGVTRDARLHVLVLEAFVGPRPTPEHEGDHEDGVRHHNTPGNLQWLTHAENLARKREFGTHATIPFATIQAIRAQPDRTLVDLAAEHGIHFSTVARVRNGQTRITA